MKFVTYAFAIGLLGLASLSASVTAQPDRRTPVPCIDTTSDTRMSVQRVGADAAQQVFGKLTSWDARTGTFGFRSELANRDESFKAQSLTFEPPLGNPVAQQAMPIAEPLGAISRSYKATEITVVDGVLKFPGCTLEHQGNRISFDGIVTFTRSKVEVQGEVLVIKPPQGGSSDSTAPKLG